MKTSPGALSGIKVVDISRVLAGPLCAQILADHGAEVIKVEPPVGDDTRKWGPPFKDGGSAYYMGVNRNKRSMVADLSQPQGREILLSLLQDADVLVENFKAGTLERWGLGYEDVLAQRFPRLIHCRISGFGGDGPLGALPGYDAVIQAMSGLMSVNGSPQTGPTRVSVPLIDLCTGVNAMAGVTLALYERTRSQRGQSIEVALYDVALSMLHPPAANWLMSGKLQPLLGSGHPNIVPYDKFRTATGEVFIGVGNDGQFANFARTLGLPELATDPRFATNPQRVAHRDALRDLLQPVLDAADGDALCLALSRAGVPAGPVRTVGEAMAHPHTTHRDMRVAFDGYEGTGIPIKLSRTGGGVTRRPPRYGEHTREILSEHGYGGEDIAAMLAAGIVREKE